jgi:hypothetical protein
MVGGDMDQFREWAALAIEAAKALAPYQSPRLTAVAIGAPAISKIEIVGGMSDAEFEIERAQLPADLPPGTIVEAEPKGDVDPDDAVPATTSAGY